MRRHGCVVAGHSLRRAVMIAVYLQVNAMMQLQAMQLGKFDYLTPADVEKCSARQATPPWRWTGRGNIGACVPNAPAKNC